MKTLLILVFILLALAGVTSALIYASIPKAGVKIGKISLLPRENMVSARGGSAYGGEGATQFTPLTQVESDNLALIEDQSLLGLTAGAFNPWFTPLLASEQNTLNSSAQQNHELENMTAGDADENARIGWGVGLVILLFLIGIPF